MQAGTEENHNGNGCGNNGAVQPCACCAALAQLRMPWMDAAVQHAAPHYPYPAYYQSSHSQEQTGARADDSYEDEEESGSERKTLFFKLPSFGKSKNGRGKSKHNKSIKHAAKQRKAAQAEATQGSGSENDNEDAVSTSENTIEDSEKFSAEEEHANQSDWQNQVPKKPRFRLSFGIQGLAVGLLGILMPTFILASSILSTPKRITLVLLHHPFETIVEFLLVAGIPLVNYLVWSALCKGRPNLSRFLIMALGAATSSALVVSGFSFAGLFGNTEELAAAIGSDFSMGFAWLGMLGLLSASVSAYLINRLRLSWELPSSRMKVTMQAVTGMILSLLSFAVSEYRPWCIRLAQYNAVSKVESTRKEGLAWLRELNPEREMRMECSDSRAAGLPGLFLPIKTSVQHQLYFTLTGTPYSFRDEKSTDLASMSDDYLSRHVVGDKIPHLDLTRSSLNGVLHADTLSSTLNWTFVVKNANSYDQEMRAEIGLPPGAAITGLTVWQKGEPDDAAFVASGKVTNANMVNAGGDTPAMVTDLGHGRVLLHCYPVPHDEELKVRLSMIVPLKSESAGSAALVTPQLIAANFSLDGEHQMRLRSKNALTSAVKDLELSRNAAGDNIISGNLSTEQLETSPLLITAKRAQLNKPFAVLDRIAIKHRLEDEKQKERIRIEKAKQKEAQRLAAEKADQDEIGQVVLMIDGSRGVRTQFDDLSKMLKKHKSIEKKHAIQKRVITIKPQYVLEKITRMAAPAPKQLVVVIDGSSSMNKYKDEVKKALSSLPPSIPCSVIVASQENSKPGKAEPLASFLSHLDKLQFVGGQDNLQAVVKASELAGETAGAAVLWVHGPQPVLNQEIYIMSPYESAPAFYELPVIAGTDTFEFFKNHAEIGPFAQVPRNGLNVADDLSKFFSKWNPDNNSYVSSLSEVETLPQDALVPDKDEARELLTLRAVQECERLVSSRHFQRAARIAVAYGFVSPVSSAYLDNNKAQAVDADLNTGENEDSEGTEQASSIKVSLAQHDAFDVATPLELKQPAALQGASNGTIGPQGADATLIMGVNTAGTVRVNNLANLEALLNIIANLGELGAIVSGLGLAIHGLMSRTVTRLGDDVELGPGGKVTLGVIMIVLGLSLPAVLNWFVASARDANLFS